MKLTRKQAVAIFRLAGGFCPDDHEQRAGAQRDVMRALRGHDDNPHSVMCREIAHAAFGDGKCSGDLLRRIIEKEGG